MNEKPEEASTVDERALHREVHIHQDWKM